MDTEQETDNGKGGDDDTRWDELVLAPRPTGRTLLPRPVAGAVSTAVRVASKTVKLGLIGGGMSIMLCKWATVGSLTAAKYVVCHGLAHQARQTTAANLPRGVDAADAEATMEKLLQSILSGLSKLELWTNSSLDLAMTSVTAIGRASSILLNQLDQLFGSTDSSRIIASILYMLCGELQNPANGVLGETIGLMEVAQALARMCFLQSHCYWLDDEQEMRDAMEETVWDVVILNDGERIDVEGLQIAHKSELRAESPRSVGIGDENLPETNLRSQVVRTLQPNAAVSISTQTTLSKTITVEVSGSDSIPFEAPPGVEIVEESYNSPEQQHLSDNEAKSKAPTYRVVYKYEKTGSWDTSIRGTQSQDGPTERVVEELDTTNGHLQPTITDAAAAGQDPAMSPIGPSSPSSPSGPSLKVTAASLTPPSSPEVIVNTPEAKVVALSPDPAAELPGTKTERSSGEEQGACSPFHVQASNLTLKPLPSVPHKAAAVADIKQKKSGIKNALKESGTALSSMLHREPAEGKGTAKSSARGTIKRTAKTSTTATSTKSSTKITAKNIAKDASKTKQTKFQLSKDAKKTKIPIPSGNSSNKNVTLVSRKQGSRKLIGRPEPNPYEYRHGEHSRCSSRTSFVSVHDTIRDYTLSQTNTPHESKSDSIVSQTEAFAIHSQDGLLPVSSPLLRQEIRTQRTIIHNHQRGSSIASNSESLERGHQRRGSVCPDTYTLGSNPSSTSLVLSPYPRSVFHQVDALDLLRRRGKVSGMFPDFHFLRNVTRYMRFSSATYGSAFMQAFKISPTLPVDVSKFRLVDAAEQKAFAHHTRVDMDDIMMASFEDTQGGSDRTGATDTNVPLVHYIVVDHASKAVVLACRGTLESEDVVADMMCDYDDLSWQGNKYKVHKGIHASARRILYGRDGRVFRGLRQALLKYPEYGLILTGHSLGAGVTSLLGIMLATPDPAGAGFVISAKPHDSPKEGASSSNGGDTCLPGGRPIHVFAYGPPGVMAPRLQSRTRGLITTIVNGNDIVPYLSLGFLHDMIAATLAFRQDGSESLEPTAHRPTRVEVLSQVTARWCENWFCKAREDGKEFDEWCLGVLRTLRATMTNAKLVPPGEVFTMETQDVLRRDAFVSGRSELLMGRPARRVTIKYVKDVEKRFKELRFQKDLMSSHLPVRYEEALNRLFVGVVGR